MSTINIVIIKFCTRHSVFPYDGCALFWLCIVRAQAFIFNDNCVFDKFEKENMRIKISHCTIYWRLPDLDIYFFLPNKGFIFNVDVYSHVFFTLKEMMPIGGAGGYYKLC